MPRVGIEAGDVLIASAARVHEGIPVLHTNLFDGLETVS